MQRFLAVLILVSAVGLVCADEPSFVPQMLQTLKPRHIGPANMSGRITEVAVYEKLPRIQYVASASGGLWKTINNGITFEPVFDRGSTVALGAVAVAATDPTLVWIGTGENNPRNSVSWGDGVYRSLDGGKTWINKGLRDSWHIGRIVIHPTNPQIVYVAAMGKFWAANPERGVFRTTDAGTTWKKVLYLDDSTGAIDLAIDPDQPETLYACMYQVRRDAFSGGNPVVQTGSKAGIYKTTDGGTSWNLLTRGLPNRPFGRCGVSVYCGNSSVVYAVVQTDKTNVTVQGQLPNEKLGPDAGGVFRSNDGGATWTHLNSLCPRPFYYGQIRVDPTDDQRVYVLGINFHVSSDGGKSFTKGQLAKGTHGDYHALWINPGDPSHLVLGCDGGLNYSFDKGANWEHLKNLPVAQFYAIGLDMQRPYRVFGGLQDNGTWGAPSATRDAGGITLADWQNYLGYDGYYCQADPEDGETLYCEGQYGILRRINLRTLDKVDIKPRLVTKEGDTNIRPKPYSGMAEFRYNWSSPILMSQHNRKTIYFAGNHLFRSDDRGDIWNIASPDLTRGKPGPSDDRGHTITTIAESPLQRGLLYVGTDDGNVQVSRDAGRRWQNMVARVPVPDGGTVTRVAASHFQAGLVYLSIDRHRNDDRTPYLLKSEDYGQSWRSIANNLPSDGPIHVVREDLRNPDLLYVGTEFGLFLSMDAGITWHKQQQLPTVPVHDLVIHPRDRELVIATHGRGIFIMDAAPLQDLTARNRAEGVYLSDIRPAQGYRQYALRKLGIKSYAGENPPYGASFNFWLDATPAAPPQLTVTDREGRKVFEMKSTKGAGLHRLQWDVNYPDTKQDEYYPVPTGDYTANLRVGSQVIRKTFKVETEE